MVAHSIRGRDTYGARFSIVVVAEGAIAFRSDTDPPTPSGEYVERLGGIGVRITAELERLTGKEARMVVLGHLQRGARQRASTACWRHGSAPAPSNS